MRRLFLAWTGFGAALVIGACSQDSSYPVAPASDAVGTLVIAGFPTYSRTDSVRLLVRSNLADACVVANVGGAGSEPERKRLVDGGAHFPVWRLSPDDGLKIIEATLLRDGKPVGTVRDSVVLDRTPPATVPALTSPPDGWTTAATNLQLAWTAPGDADALTYRVVVQDSVGTVVRSGVARTPAAAVVGLAPDAPYTWSVTAVDPAGNASAPREGSFRTWPFDLPAFVHVPAGVFRMGSPIDEPGRSLGEVLHKVTLTTDRYFATTEVTWGTAAAVLDRAYRAGLVTCDGDTIYDAVGAESRALFSLYWFWPFTFAGDGFVLDDATLGPKICWWPWYGAAAFGDWLNLLGGGATRFDHQGTWTDPDIYGGTGYRLPTSAEWEYACRAGTQTAYYNGTADFHDCCVSDDQCCCYDAVFEEIGYYCRNFREWNYRPGTKRPNPWGIYDMLGGYGEWCYDSNDYDITPATVDPVFGGPSLSKIVRGAPGGTFGMAIQSRAASVSAFTIRVLVPASGLRLVWSWQGEVLQ